MTGPKKRTRHHKAPPHGGSATSAKSGKAWAAAVALVAGAVLLGYFAFSTSGESAPSLTEGSESGSASVFASAGSAKTATGVSGTWEFEQGGGKLNCGDLARDLPLVATRFSLESSGSGELQFSDQTCDYVMHRVQRGAQAKDVSCDSKQQPGQKLRIESHEVKLVDDATAQVKMNASFSLKIGQQEERECTVVAEGVAKRAAT